MFFFKFLKWTIVVHLSRFVLEQRRSSESSDDDDDDDDDDGRGGGGGGGNAVYTYNATTVSDGELECPLPPSPISNTSDSAVYTWRVSVSNDGQSYSNQLKLTVYDSNCLDCKCSGQCRIKVSNIYTVSQKNKALQYCP